MRRASAFLCVAALALTLVAGASAKSFSLVSADVQVQVARDGTLLVDERIQYAFSGPFSGGFRDVALRKGESVTDVRVSEGGKRVPAGRLHGARLLRRGRDLRREADGRPRADRLALPRR